MKILALGDPHGVLPKNLDFIIKKNTVELIVCVGDIGFVPEKPWLKESWKGVTEKVMNGKYESYVDKIASYGVPVLTLRGDTFIQGGKPFADKVLSKHKNVINRFTGSIKIKGQKFILFDVSFEPETIKEANEGDMFFLNKMRRNKSRDKRLNEILKKDSVLISHNPPYGYVDIDYRGKHVGSKIILNAIKRQKPKLVLCGHIHEAKGNSKIGKTEIWNLGDRGSYKIFEI